ncbi:unnamed protein product [Fraxinus pennsylvanica]|uniref:Uncharacterized protein n=1 Tax=Fraxinus pennsylvanica TaxID=56036 RepID=A0AAD2E0H1_9LAMI|nr:unnamed protein product [Fraxinus pennsylvanica]
MKSAGERRSEKWEWPLDQLINLWRKPFFPEFVYTGLIHHFLISGNEEPEAPMSLAIDAIIRVFKRINGLHENDGDGEVLGIAGIAFCSIRLLVASSHGISLIGKQGSK